MCVNVAKPRDGNVAEPRDGNVAEPRDGNLAEPRDGNLGLLADEDVVARICAGETRLFELLMRRHNQRLFRAARAILRRDDEAEDVMQDAYVRAFTHLADFRAEARFSTWLTRIAVHEAFARLRRERRVQSIDTLPEETTSMSQKVQPNPEQEVADAELRAVLEHAIDALPESFRLVFVLRSVEQLSGAEVAEVLGIPEQTVKTRLFRARERLQAQLSSAFEARIPETYGFELTRCDRVVKAVFARLGISDGAGSEPPPPHPASELGR